MKNLTEEGEAIVQPNNKTAGAPGPVLPIKSNNLFRRYKNLKDKPNVQSPSVLNKI